MFGPPNINVVLIHLNVLQRFPQSFSHFVVVAFRLKNNQGKTAGDLAKERNKLEVSRRIEQVENKEEVLPSSSSSKLSKDGVAGSLDSETKSEGRAEVRAILECPVCLETMSMCKIYQCKFGHNVCERCCINPLLNICPQCREPYRNIRVRNLGLEELARVQHNL